MTRHSLERARSTRESRWFRRFAMPRAQRRLFCFPYAGGSARVYRNWQDWLAPDVEVVAVELPGRGVHIGEAPIDDMDELVDRLVPEIRPLLDRPFALFGHSLGALVAFALSGRLDEGDGPVPSHLFVSAMRAPHLPSRLPDVHHLPDAELTSFMRQLQGTPEEVLANEELLGILLPLLRADLRLGETYRCPPTRRRPHPITAFGGFQDPSFERGDLEAWREHTAGAFRMRLLPGGHFFVHEVEHLIAASIGHAMRAEERAAVDEAVVA